MRTRLAIGSDHPMSSDDLETGNERDRHLFGSHPKRVLALDGGGFRGVITVAFLEAIEDLLRLRHGAGPEFRLWDYFYLIGGTSTGAIIAAGLALGKSAKEISKFYLELAPKVFRRSRWRLRGIQTKFNPKILVHSL